MDARRRVRDYHNPNHAGENAKNATHVTRPRVRTPDISDILRRIDCRTLAVLRPVTYYAKLGDLRAITAVLVVLAAPTFKRRLWASFRGLYVQLGEVEKLGGNCAVSWHVVDIENRRGVEVAAVPVLRLRHILRTACRGRALSYPDAVGVGNTARAAEFSTVNLRAYARRGVNFCIPQRLRNANASACIRSLPRQRRTIQHPVRDQYNARSR